MRIKLFYSVIFFILCYSFLFSQNIEPKVAFNKTYFLSYYFNAKNILESPFKWNAQQRIMANITIASTLFLITKDLKIQEFVQQHKNKNINNLCKYGFEPFGGYYSLGITSMYLLHGYIFKNQRSQKTALLATQSFLLASAFGRLPKFVFGRMRPYQTNPANPYDFRGWNGGSSFFSGHTVAVFSIATIFASEYKEYWYMPILAYSIATFTALSRVYENKHWTSDVVMGAISGYAIAKLVQNKNVLNLSVVSYGGHNNSLCLTFPIISK